MELPQTSVNYLVALSHRDPDKEICGLILDNGAVHPILNVHPNPQSTFFMDPMQQLEALEIFGDRIIGMYHSHPSFNPDPSDTDKLGWPPAGWQYWIIVGRIIFEWEKDGDELTIAGSQEAEFRSNLARSVPQGTDSYGPADS